MKFEQLTFGTKVKLVAGLGLTWGGLVLLLVQGPFHVVTILFGNLLHLDGRISKMEEENESKSSKSDS
jgi:hypothetical protein